MSLPLIPGQWYIAPFSSNRSVGFSTSACPSHTAWNALTNEDLSHDGDTCVKTSTSNVTEHGSFFDTCKPEQISRSIQGVPLEQETKLACLGRSSESKWSRYYSKIGSKRGFVCIKGLEGFLRPDYHCKKSVRRRASRGRRLQR